MKKILVAGATGLIGHTVLQLLLQRKDVQAIVLARKRLTELPEQQQWIGDDLVAVLKDEPVDAVICCLGTTIKKAGSQAAFRHVDHDLVIGLGKWAGEKGVPVFSVVSAIGSDPSSWIFYNKVKGEMERDLESLPIASLNIFQPSILTGPRKETRIGERIGIVLTSLIAPFMIGSMKKFKPMPHDILAKALIVTAVNAVPGVHRHSYDGIKELADAY